MKGQNTIGRPIPPNMCRITADKMQGYWWEFP